ncbi:HYC_CC_PP family protein [Rurimicrobium arvi]
MTRRLFHLMFAVYYLCLSVGVNCSAHYCGGELVDWSVAADARPCDGCASVSDAGAEEDSCCKEQHQLLKKSGDDLKVQQEELRLTPSDWVALPAQRITFYPEAAALRIRHLAAVPVNGPPWPEDPPVYILFGHFRV